MDAANESDTRPVDGPREEYERRLGLRRGAAERLARRERVLGNSKLAVFAAGVVVAVVSLSTTWLSPLWLILPAAGFFVLAVLHERSVRGHARALRAAAYYERGLARLDGRWAGTGEPGERFQAPDHPYAQDLDLFGPGSLFELLCAARTRAGEDTLAGWLLAPAGPDEVRARQEAVAELRPRLDLREDLGLLGTDVRGGVHPEMLSRWGSVPPELPGGRRQAVLFALVGVTLAALLAWAVLDVGPTPFLLALLLQWAFSRRLDERVRRVTERVEKAAPDLALLAVMLSRLEREEFTATRLRDLRASLDTAGEPPSRRIAYLAWLIDLLNSRRNQFFAPIGFVLMWSTHLAFALERWRAASGPAVGRWLSVVGEFEALASFAAFAYENPADPFPEVVPDGPLFDGEGLGHPLLPADRCVRNDLRLGGELRVLIVSGSNMSGKSTLLRTVGVNTVLALAGGTVRATRLRLSPLAVGATLRIQDSLQAGRSRFFAEITRLRRLVDLARGPLPLLFLLDEILHGTNSHDRRLGGEAVVVGLVEAGAVGLITTHDLALAEIADRLGAAAANVHFEDHFDDGAMTFDYRLRPGVVKKSNALALMRAVGLEV